MRKIRVWLDEDAERREDGTNRDRGSVDLSWHIEKVSLLSFNSFFFTSANIVASKIGFGE